MIFDIFMNPLRLWWLVLIPALTVLYVLLIQRRKARGNAGPSIPGLERVLPRQQAWKRHAAVVAALLSLGSLTVAFAQPKGEVDVPRERATVVIAMDVSRSMIAEDVKPNRLDAAKAAATEFVDRMPPGFNIALVRFSGAAAVVVPPTTDRQRVTAAIQGLQVGPATAIGEGIYASLDAIDLAPIDPAHPDEPAPSAIVLLSDGKTNSGRDSLPAAKEAGKRGTPIYTIAYGTPTGYIVVDSERQPVPVDEDELRAVAEASKGKPFTAQSSGELRSVYQSIASSVGTIKQEQEITEFYAGIALVFAVIAALALASLAARWP